MSDDDVFYRISMIMNVDPAEIAKIVHDYIERDIGCDYDRLNCPKPPIYIGPVKVKSLKERLEEATMHADCEDCIKRDICTRDVPKPCKYRYTEEERIADQASDMFGAILHKTYLHPTFRKKKEDNEMKATSVQNIKNIKDVSITIENDPIERKSKLTIVASTNDDIFAFEFEGSDLLQSCKRAGLFSSWEKDQKIRELEKELGEWKKEASDCLRLRDEAQKEAYKLKKENEDLKEENKNLSKANDSLYKSVYKALEEKRQTKEEYEKKLSDLNSKYKLEKAADEEPSSRADILDLAKKCVCGKREQDYGTPESNFQLIADLWNQYLFKEPGAKEVFGIGPMDVSMMMALMKIARIRNGGGSGDSFVDLAGYAACGGEIWHSNKETNGDSSQETN